MSSLRLSALVLSAVVVAAAPATAQAPPEAQVLPAVRRVEFTEAVQEAVAKNPTAAAALVAIARAEALLQQARALTRPMVAAGVTNVTIDAERGFAGGVTQPQNQFAFMASATLPLLQASRWAAVGQARDQVEVATLSSTEARQQIAIAAAEAYLAVIASRRQVEVDERALENARAHLDYANKRLEGGVGSRLNQLRAAQSVAGDDARLEATRLALRRAQESLGVLLAEDGPVDAGAEPVLEAPAVVTDTEWMNARPDLRARSATVRAAERVIRDSWKEWLPTAGLAFEPQLVTPSGLFQPSRTWRLVFSVSQPVFDSGPRARTALRRTALSEAQFAHSATEIQARSEIRLAQESVSSRQRALQSAQLAAEHANEVLRISTTVFEVGAATNLEVIDAQRSARDAETTAALAEDAVRRARLDLLVAVGRFP